MEAQCSTSGHTVEVEHPRHKWHNMIAKFAKLRGRLTKFMLIIIINEFYSQPPPKRPIIPVS